jgi:hypothetical protein
MHDPREPHQDGNETQLTIVLPVRPGQSEAWRRLIQELQQSRREDFDAAYRRWGVRSLTIWLAPSRPGDLVVAQVKLAEDLADAEEQLARSREPFDQWITERARELHGVDLSNGVARYRAELIGVWPEQTTPEES